MTRTQTTLLVCGPRLGHVSWTWYAVLRSGATLKVALPHFAAVVATVVQPPEEPMACSVIIAPAGHWCVQAVRVTELPAVTKFLDAVSEILLCGTVQ